MKAQPVFTDSKELIDFINTVKFDTAGLFPAVVQDVENNEVLMVAWMNQESLRRTLESGQAWFYSRKRQALWLKGRPAATTSMLERCVWIAMGIHCSLKLTRWEWPVIWGPGHVFPGLWAALLLKSEPKGLSLTFIP